MTEAITLAQAQAKLDALMAASASNSLMVRFGQRTIQYKTAKDLLDEINYWTRVIAEKRRIQGGVSRHGFSVAKFGSNV